MSGREEAQGLLSDLDAGRVRAARPDPDADDGWFVDSAVQGAILGLFDNRETRTWDLDGALRFRDRIGLPVKGLIDSPEALAALAAGKPWRVVPGGTSVRGGVYLGPGVTIMPPSYINIGAWVGEGTMVDSHVLVGSCAQIGSRVHLSAGVQIGGVLEPPGRRPVIVEDDVFIGAHAAVLEGVLVQRGAVIGAGVILTGTSRLYDLIRDRVIVGTLEEPLVVPAGAVVAPGGRRVQGEFAAAHGLVLSAPIVVKYRDERTDARVALEEALR
ncbi:MAG: 2,3,4,5-tetrahydropyridine-2,6-dicarboxylate N-succinyltransferase [Candidatus Limnocylindrales bacterium]